MSPLLLICDPTYQYSRAFHEMLGAREIVSRHALTAEDCLNAIRLFTPDFVLIACETDDGFLGPLLHRIETLPDRAPDVFLIGSATPQALSDTWGRPVENCLQRPLDESGFVTLLASLSEEQTVVRAEREDGVGNGARPLAGGTAWENEGGALRVGLGTAAAADTSVSS